MPILPMNVLFGFIINIAAGYNHSNIAAGHNHNKVSAFREKSDRECMQLEHQQFANT